MATLKLVPKTLTDFLVEFTGKVREVPAFKDIIHATQDVSERLTKISNAIGDFASSLTPAVEFPYSEVLITRQRIKDLIIQAGPVLDVSFRFILVLREANRQLSQLTLSKEIFVSRSQASEAVENVFSSDPLPRKVYTIQTGDTLIAIANTLVRTRPRLDVIAQIIEMNSLDYPYIVTNEFDETVDPALNVARAGDTIFVPQDSQLRGSLVASTVKEKYTRLFGTDILLMGSSNVNSNGNNGTVDFDPGTNDLYLVSGEENLAQSIHLGILNDTGSLPLHPDYGSGFARFMGLPGVADNVQLATFEVGRAVLRNPRVAQIDHLQGAMSDPVPTALVVSYRATPIDSDTPISMSLVIPR